MKVEKQDRGTGKNLNVLNLQDRDRKYCLWFMEQKMEVTSKKIKNIFTVILGWENEQIV